MGLNTDGINAILIKEADIDIALGNGPSWCHQTSHNRKRLTFTVTNGGIVATGVPYRFKGMPLAGASDVLFFDAESGKFLGSCPISGSRTYDSFGEYEMTDLTISAATTPSTLGVKQCNISIEKWSIYSCWRWQVTYYLPDDPHGIVTTGTARTKWGARRRALRTIGRFLR